MDGAWLVTAGEVVTVVDVVVVEMVKVKSGTLTVLRVASALMSVTLKFENMTANNLPSRGIEPL